MAEAKSTTGLRGMVSKLVKRPRPGNSTSLPCRPIGRTTARSSSVSRRGNTTSRSTRRSPTPRTRTRSARPTSRRARAPRRTYSTSVDLWHWRIPRCSRPTGQSIGTTLVRRPTRSEAASGQPGGYAQWFRLGRYCGHRRRRSAEARYRGKIRAQRDPARAGATFSTAYSWWHWRRAGSADDIAPASD